MAEDAGRAKRRDNSDTLRLSRGDVIALVVAFVLTLVPAVSWLMPVEASLGEGLEHGATGFALSLLGGVLGRMTWRYVKPKLRKRAQVFLDIHPTTERVSERQN